MEQWRLDPERYDPNHEVVEVASYGEWQRTARGATASARNVLLTHHEDPISKVLASSRRSRHRSG